MAPWTKYGIYLVISLQPAVVSAQVALTSDSTSSEQVVLDADDIYVDEADNTVIAEGNVQAVYQGRILRADRLIYDRDTDKVRASGNVVILDPDGTQRFATEIETDSNLSDGYAIGFSTRMPNGGVATSESAIRTENGYNALDKVIYTSCEVCDEDSHPTWALRARRAVLNQESKMISYRDAVLEIGGFPVVYLPYFAHPDPNSGRRSGLMFPDIGVSTKRGVFYQQPYYWAISPYSDLEFSPEVSSIVAPLAEFTYRKKFWSGDMSANFSVTNERDFDSDGEFIDGSEKEWRGHIYADGRFNINSFLQWGFGIEQVSDDLYTRRYDIDLPSNKRGLYEGQINQSLSQLFVSGQNTNRYGDVFLLKFEDLRENGNDAILPTVAPAFTLGQTFDLGQFGQANIESSGEILERETGFDRSRLSIGSEWETSARLPGGMVLNPFAEARYDYFDITDENTVDTQVERSVATIGTRLSYPLYRSGKTVDILIEPTAMIAYGTPGANDPVIPDEDSLFFELDESTLFEANSATGFDRYESGSKAALGIAATARMKNGFQVRAEGGRRWRSETDDPTFNRFNNLDQELSDWVGSISTNLGKYLSMEARVRLDPDSFSINRVDASSSIDWWRLSADARYFKLDEAITSNQQTSEGIVLSSEFELTDNYSVIYGRSRDIAANRDATHSFGLAYRDDCSRFELVYQRREGRDRTLGPSESIKFAFTLKSLGEFGSANVD